MLLSALLLAQSATTPPPLVVTASRLPPPTSAVRIEGPELDSAGSVAAVLAGVPQLFVAQAGGRSGFAAPTLDGADPNFVLVLFDGVPINNATSSRGGAVNLAEIAGFGLAGIELLPAQLSAVHGSGALAGVLALNPRGPTERPALTVRAGVMTQGGQTLGAALSGPLGGGWGATLTGQSDDDGSPTPLTRFEAHTALLRVARGDSGHRLLLRFNAVESAGFPDASGGALLARRRLAEQRRAREWLGAVRTRQALGPGLVLDLNASWLNRRDTIDSPGVAGGASNPAGLPASLDTTRYDRLLGQASLAWTGGTTQFAAGIEGGHERGRSAGQLDFGGFALPTAYRLDRRSWAGFVELASRIGAVSGSAALRVDRIGDLKARLSGRIAATAVLGRGWRLESAAGTSFKAASFYALANPLVGNPALRPETGRRADLTLIWQQAGTRVRLGGFVARYEDLIDFVFQPAPALVNRGRVAVDGLSASLAQQLGPVGFDLAVQHVWPRDRAGGPDLLLRPRWRANAALRWQASPRLVVNLRAGQVGARDDESVPGGRQRLAPYVLAAADARWQATERLAVRLAADNLLDAGWQDAAGFPAPPLRLRLLADVTL
ncbi:TonB-dependent receptor plug domain-containing protein [Novosphingobium piscinae]|uniref:TonB-dependent receptor n=1 Tax=Novosphingobium piscinae TaxID=1507448 RepID=A0A7X1FZC5_9SPHN|nr:TonB-dependent receptor [Novosphingobium piscinae]MBC2669771.1 TonB-dependent receptor [Novosphingobium piscinae]